MKAIYKSYKVLLPSSQSDSVVSQQSHTFPISVSAVLAGIVAVLTGAVPIWIASLALSDSVYPVDRKTCRNSCFDTVFKGPYESGISKYKHVYFNCTWNTFKIWVITVLAILIVYETFKRMFRLAWSPSPGQGQQGQGRQCQLRWPMLFLFATSAHSNFYGWWMAWNYWNDDFYSQWYHQLFFTVTELTTTGIVVYYMDRNVEMKPLPLIVVANISIFHIWASGLDQFVVNVLYQTGASYQVLRDLFFMQSDIFHTGIALYYIREAVPRGNSVMPVIFSKKHVWTMIILTLTMCVALASVPNLK